MTRILLLKAVVAGVTTSFLLGIVSCSQQDFSRPITGVRQTTVRTRAVASPEASAEARSDRLAAVLRQWSQAHVREAKDYMVGPGDELAISIYALEHPNETTEILRTIGRDGKLSLLWVGDLDIRGKTVRELEQIITAAYAERFIKNPQVAVQVKNFRSVAVLMTGAVRNPGVYYLSDNYSTVLEMLAKAGGLSADAADEVLVIQGGVPIWFEGETTNDTENLDEVVQTAMLSTNELVSISLRKLIDEGDLLMNVKVGAGAIISVKSMAEQYVYVLGYVQRPGAFPIRGSQQVDALRAVALAGGLAATARAENSFLVRETPEGQMVLPVNLARIARGSDPTVYLQPGDTLVVGSSTLARLSEFVRPSVGAGMTYTPLP